MKKKEKCTVVFVQLNRIILWHLSKRGENLLRMSYAKYTFSTFCK